MSSTISDEELANLPALRRRFYVLEEAQMKTLATSVFRPEVLREFKSQGTDEVALLRLMLEMKVIQDVAATATASESEVLFVWPLLSQNHADDASAFTACPKSAETGHERVVAQLSA
jgi:hypothetical protein